MHSIQGKLSQQTSRNDTVKTKKKKKRKASCTKATAKPEDVERTVGTDSIETKSVKRKGKKRKINDSVADQSVGTEVNLSAVSGADKPGEGVVHGAEVSLRKKRKKKKSTSKKNKYAHLGRKGVSENLCPVDPSAVKNSKTCVEPVIGAMADKNVSMINDDKSGRNEKQILQEKSAVNSVDGAVKSLCKKRKFVEIESKEESLSKSNGTKRDKESGTVKKRKISSPDEGSYKFCNNRLVKEGVLKKKQKSVSHSSEIRNEVEMGSVKKQQASSTTAYLQKNLGSGEKIKISEKEGGFQKSKQKKKRKKKNDKDLGSNILHEEKSFSQELTPHKKHSPRKLPFNMDKLRATLAAAKTPSQPKEVAENEGSIQTPKQKKSKSNVRKAADKDKAEPSLRESMMARLSAARFRLINEELYTSTSKDAVELFKTDHESFKIYHEGYQSQVAKWPTVPVDKMVQYIKNR